MRRKRRDQEGAAAEHEDRIKMREATGFSVSRVLLPFKT
jgi:hypothetical protein